MAASGPRMKAAWALWLGGAACLLGGIALSVQLRERDVEQDAGIPVTSAEPRVQARIVSSFSEFAGSAANARSLVAGLRQGGEVALTAPGSGTGTRFTPPTRAMTYRDIRISLALAQQQLGQLGIRQPTPFQIKAALAGGAVTNHADARATPVLLPGVLQMRAHGMGWGNVADALGMSLGKAVSSIADPPAVAGRTAPAPPSIAASVAHAVAKTEAPRQGRANGVPPPGSAASPGSGTTVAKSGQSVKPRPAHTPALPAAVSTPGDAATALAPKALAPAPSGVMTAAESPAAGATVAAPPQGPGNEPITGTTGARTPAPGAAEEHGTESTGTAD